MFIHKRAEGGKLYLGLNWMSNKMTLLSLSFVIPLYLFYSKRYEDFAKCNFYRGLRLRTFCFYFRIRRMKNFPSGTNMIIHHAKLDVRSLSKQQLISEGH